MTPLPCPLFARLAADYFAAILHAATRRSALPLDRTVPPRGLCCIVPPAMTEGT